MSIGQARGRRVRVVFTRIIWVCFGHCIWAASTTLHDGDAFVAVPNLHLILNEPIAFASSYLAAFILSQGRFYWLNYSEYRCSKTVLVALLIDVRRQFACFLQ
ncbi:uncharacterized protein B0H18DRAFT_1051408 [Fomitopsis serialis]|uniref:uncharacterized protein n=1 Tax=Fomitopsis serialis TaxID=139415 RepID=UPI00200833DA|nr:uncharacterized protein B0H18DRAFT_1051456 [Neoantrodia serialis]XP_047885701.1 uncharacterized protein B0H18DRAFT_1051408 [Neoantrodia serialis]KAH9912866.1 hypothetical protein B0H18DRAFT_1051456 [Neoantrodia serialis]KAH9912898.1 hypothetical protein B0H18DRAFT_1051408 [Neoantrodia serialis]